MISNYYPLLEMGGWPQLTRDIVDKLRERGHRVLVMTSRHMRERLTVPEDGILRVLYLQSPDRDNYHIHYAVTARWHEHENSRYLKQTVASFSPDMIFIHGLWNVPRKLALDAERLFPEQIVYYMADYWPVELDAHTAFWMMPTRRPWLRAFKRLLAILIQRVVLSNAVNQPLKLDRVICVSRFVQNYFVHRTGIPVEHTRVIHNGIDVSEFGFRALDQRKRDDLKLVYAGGFWERKGVITALEALGNLIYHFNIRNIHLTLIGAGHPAYIKKMNEKIRELRIENYVSFKARVQRDQMPVLLKSYDVLLFPSTGDEPLARMIQEAMACGLLVIGSTAGGTPEILVDGVNGFSFEPGDSIMMAQKIAIAASNPDLCNRLILTARHTVEENFTMDGMVDKLEGYFASL